MQTKKNWKQIFKYSEIPQKNFKNFKVEISKVKKKFKPNTKMYEIRMHEILRFIEMCDTATHAHAHALL